VFCCFDFLLFLHRITWEEFTLESEGEVGKIRVGRQLSDSTKSAFSLLQSMPVGKTPIHLRSRSGLENRACRMLLGPEQLACKTHLLSQKSY